jgi:hypothetical protein
MAPGLLRQIVDRRRRDKVKILTQRLRNLRWQGACARKVSMDV